jgi:hypothetical protein
MKQSQLIRIVLLCLLLGVAANATAYAAQGRGQQKGRSDKKEKGKPDTPPGQDKQQDNADKSLPDGRWIFFSSNREQKGQALYRKVSNGAVPEELLVENESGTNLFPLDASVDGKWLLFAKGKGGTRDLWALNLIDKKATPYLATSFDENTAAFSPNAKWVAYMSNESGRYEIVVQPFPDPSGGKYPISTNGGVFPRWRRDGKEFYYLDPEQGIIAVSVTTAGDFNVGKSRRLFQPPFGAPDGFVGAMFPYDVAADGQQFLLSVPRGRLNFVQSPPLTVTVNWTAALR